MVDRFKDVGLAYSLGINDDVSWDLDIAGRGIEVYQYDPTIEALPQDHELFHWKPIWIHGGVENTTNRSTLESLINQNGHAERNDMILKCDIEGAEWLLLQQTPNRVLQQFSQMVFEIHNLSHLVTPYHANNVRRAFFNLTSSHHVVHVHGNNFAGWQVMGGIPVPAVMELTLVRKDAGDFEPSDETFPTALDMPCNSSLADMHLGNFNY
jgi:hypothetical protein